MTQHQAENCLTLAFWLADCMTDAEFRRFWECPQVPILKQDNLFHDAPRSPTQVIGPLFGHAAYFVLSGQLTTGLGIARNRVDRCAIATALLCVVDVAGWQIDNG